jgi:hypothetical protein
MNTKLKLISLSVLLALGGCVSEKDDPTPEPEPNQKPVVSILDKNHEIDERSTVRIPFNGSDADGDDITYTLTVDPAIGTASVEDNEIVYVSENISSSTVVNITLRGTDGKESVQDTATVMILEAFNDAPVLDLSDTSFEFEEGQTVLIPMTYTDADGDELTVSLNTEASTGLNLTATEATGGIQLVIGEIDAHEAIAKVTLTIADSQEIVEQEITVVVTNRLIEEQPIIEIIGDPIVVNELGTTEISYTLEDPNTDLAALNVSYSLADEINAKVTLDIPNNKLIIEQVNIEGDQSVELTMTVSDEYHTVTDTATLNFVEQVDVEMQTFLSAYTPVMEKFNAVKDRNDEISLFYFYEEVAKVVASDKLVEIAAIKAQLQPIYDADKSEIQPVIDIIDAYVADINRDQSELPAMYASLETITSKVDNFGIDALIKLNDANVEMGNVLPPLSFSTISDVTIGGVTYYSRYVGNNRFGFASNDETWIFSTSYKFMEYVNVVNTYCQ